MIGVIDVRVSAHKPNMPLCPCFTFKDSPSSLRILDVPKQIGSWRITEVFAMFHYPDDVVKTKSAVREGNVWVATVEGCSTSGKVTNGLTIAANGIDEDGNAVPGYVLGIGDIYVMNRDDSIAPDPSTQRTYMRLCDELPSTPTKGDAYFQNGVLVIYNGTTWVPSFDSSSISSIQDENGNVINADRTVGYNLPVNAAWKMENTLTHQQFVLTSDNGTTFSYSDQEPYTVDSWKATMSWTEGGGYLYWHFITYQWAGVDVEWESVDEVFFYFTTQDQTDMQNDFWHGTRPVTITSELALESQLPTKTSDLTNDSGFITVEEVPTPNEIQDNSGNVIHANRTVNYISDTDKWTVNIDSQDYVFTGEKADAAYAPENPQSGDKKYTLNWSEIDSMWFLKYYTWADGTWDQTDFFSSYDGYESTFLTFNEGEGQTASWGQVVESDELALKSYVDGQIGQVLTEAF